MADYCIAEELNSQEKTTIAEIDRPPSLPDVEGLLEDSNPATSSLGLLTKSHSQNEKDGKRRPIDASLWSDDSSERWPSHETSCASHKSSGIAIAGSPAVLSPTSSPGSFDGSPPEASALAGILLTRRNLRKHTERTGSIDVTMVADHLPDGPVLGRLQKWIISHTSCWRQPPDSHVDSTCHVTDLSPAQPLSTEPVQALPSMTPLEGVHDVRKPKMPVLEYNRDTQRNKLGFHRTSVACGRLCSLCNLNQGAKFCRTMSPTEDSMPRQAR